MTLEEGLIKAQQSSGLEDPPLCICREGYVIKRISRYGQFYGCTAYPKCTMKYTSYEVNQMYDPDYDEPYFGM